MEDMSFMFSGCSSLSTITVGSSYHINSSDMFPDATASSGKWRSARDGGWYTTDEIVSSRSQLADVYISDIASGTWGSCPWRIDRDGVLVVSLGTGADTGDVSPWEKWADTIESVTFAEVGDAKVVAPSDCSSLLIGMDSVKSVDLSGLDTSNVTTMGDLFLGCSSLESVDNSDWDTSKVTDMSGLFQAASSSPRSTSPHGTRRPWRTWAPCSPDARRLSHSISPRGIPRT